MKRNIAEKKKMWEEMTNGIDYVKETKKDIDYLIKEATKECEDSMYGTYDAANCICQKLNKFSWIDEKLAARRKAK